MSTDIESSENPLSSSPAHGLVESIENQFDYQSWQGIKTIVSVSGGPDSVALLRGLLSLAQRHGDKEPKNLIVAHVDHGLRGAESTADAKFVESLAKSLGLKYFLANSIQRDAKPASASEESLRNFRYDNLLDTAKNLGARYIVTGHNQNDQIETILFRIFRGTGIGGLSGIPAVRLGNDSVSIVRPLLQTSRSTIEAFLREIGQEFRIDSSNRSLDYQRNFIRNQLLPLIEERFGSQTQASILRLSEQATEANAFIEAESKSLEAAIISRTPTTVQLDCSVLSSHSPLLVRQLLVGIWTSQNWPRQAMGFDWWEKICAGVTVQQPADKNAVVLNLPGGIRFTRSRNDATFLKTPHDQ